MAGGVATESVFQLRAGEIVVVGKGEVRWGGSGPRAHRTKGQREEWPST